MSISIRVMSEQTPEFLHFLSRKSPCLLQIAQRSEKMCLLYEVQRSLILNVTSHKESSSTFWIGPEPISYWQTLPPSPPAVFSPFPFLHGPPQHFWSLPVGVEKNKTKKNSLVKHCRKKTPCCCISVQCDIHRAPWNPFFSQIILYFFHSGFFPPFSIYLNSVVFYPSAVLPFFLHGL